MHVNIADCTFQKICSKVKLISYNITIYRSHEQYISCRVKFSREVPTCGHDIDSPEDSSLRKKFS